MYEMPHSSFRPDQRPERGLFGSFGVDVHGSQPMLETANNEQFFCMLDAMHADETLVYASDWPHWDWDDPATTFPKLPERLHRRIFSENARELFGL